MEPFTLQTSASLRKVTRRMPQAAPLVLLIEDDPQSLYLMERYPDKSGCRALPTKQGARGLRLAREKQRAVIFLELRLPDISGTEVLHALRSDPVTQPIPVIICTVLNEAEAAQALEEDVGYLHKPIYYQDFLNALR